MSLRASGVSAPRIDVRLRVPQSAEAVLPRLRVPLLVLFGLVVAHDTIFASDAGVAALAGALARSGHGDIWAAVSVLGLGGAAIVGLGTVARILRLRREIGTLDRSQFSADAPQGLADVYRSEVRRLWPRLFCAIAIGFLLQENLEAIAGSGRLVGLDPLFGVHPFAVPILLVLTLAMSAIGALVRRETHALEQLVSRLRARAARHAETRTPRPSNGALHLRDLIRLRPQAGRAPPLRAAPVSA